VGILCPGHFQIFFTIYFAFCSIHFGAIPCARGKCSQGTAGRQQRVSKLPLENMGPLDGYGSWCGRGGGARAHLLRHFPPRPRPTAVPALSYRKTNDELGDNITTINKTSTRIRGDERYELVRRASHASGCAATIRRQIDALQHKTCRRLQGNAACPRCVIGFPRPSLFCGSSAIFLHGQRTSTTRTYRPA